MEEVNKLKQQETQIKSEEEKSSNPIKNLKDRFLKFFN